MAKAEQEGSKPTISHRLELCADGEIRSEIWVDYVTNNSDALAQDSNEAAILISDGDIEGLRAHLSRLSRERASAHVAAILSKSSGEDLPPAA